MKPALPTSFFTRHNLMAFLIFVLAGCASVVPKQAIRVAQPDNTPIRNFTSFSASLRCLDGMLARAKRPRTLISSTGFPDFSKKITVGADEMLVNAVNQMNRQSGAYVFIDQSLEKDWGQINLLTPHEDNLRPTFYIRAAVTQVDKGVVSDSGSLNLDFTNAPNAWNPFKATLKQTKASAGREVSVVTVDMHLVSFPDKIIIPGSSVANTMVVVSNNRGVGANGLIRLTGFDFSINIARIESMGQAVRNLAELGVIELLGRHARVPYWDCLNIRPSTQKLDNLDEVRFDATARPLKVKQIQQMLRKLGYLNTDPNSKYDRVTRQAVSHFQADQRLIANGEMNYQLFVLLQEKSKGFSTKRRPFPSNSGSTTPPAIALSPGRSSYRKGDILQLKLLVRQDGYINCFHQSNTGPIVQILPLEPNQRLRATQGGVVNIPDQNAQFDIKFESKGATEGVLCILDADTTGNSRPVALTRGPLQPVKARSFQEIAEIFRRGRKKISVAEFRTKSR